EESRNDTRRDDLSAAQLHSTSWTKKGAGSRHRDRSAFALGREAVVGLRVVQRIEVHRACQAAARDHADERRLIAVGYVTRGYGGEPAPCSLRSHVRRAALFLDRRHRRQRGGSCPAQLGYYSGAALNAVLFLASTARRT